MGAYAKAKGISASRSGGEWRRVSRAGSGFTLIELLVVIGIIAVLAAIAIPVYSRAQEKGRQATCLSNMHAIAIAMRMYQQDYHAYPPPYDVLTGEGGIGHLYESGYLESVRSLRCPNDQLVDFAAYDTLYGSLAPDHAQFVSDWTSEQGYFVEHYCSYNVDSTIDPDTDDDGVVDDEWYDLNNNNSTDAGETFERTFILYNYNGYNIDGHEKAAPTAPPNPSPGHQGVKYPRLYNRWAPDNTIITHCPYHRSYFGGYDVLTAQDVVVRVGGDAALTQVGTWGKTGSVDHPRWVDQPYE